MNMYTWRVALGSPIRESRGNIRKKNRPKLICFGRLSYSYFGVTLSYPAYFVIASTISG